VNRFKSKTSAGYDDAGYDDIPVDIMKFSIWHIALGLYLAKIINLSFTTGFVPNRPVLKIAKVCPIYKNGDKTDINNYRPISVLPMAQKSMRNWSIIDYPNTSRSSAFWMTANLAFVVIVQRLWLF